jgi:hypothetical protein
VGSISGLIVTLLISLSKGEKTSIVPYKKGELIADKSGVSMIALHLK